MTRVRGSGENGSVVDGPYLVKVGEYFLAKRGRGLLLSPKDWELAHRWQQAGIPLPVVLRGISSAFWQAGSRRSRIHFLAYCQKAVEWAWTRFKRQRLGTQNPGNGTDSDAEELLQSLLELKEKLRRWAKDQSEKPGLGEVALDIAGKLGEQVKYLRGSKAEMGEVLAELSKLREHLTESALKQLPPEEMANIEATVQKQLYKYHRHMSAEVYAETKGALCGKLGLKYYGLPSLDLYEL